MNKLLKQISFIVALTLSVSALAQQDPHYTMYMYNMNIVNPAYAGSDETLNIGFLHREQWVGITGAPSTFTANIHSPVGKGVGAGFSVIQDQIGPTSETNMYADVSYTFPVSDTGKMSLGLKAGGTLFNLDSGLSVTDLGEILNSGLSQFFPNLGAGAFYHTQKFYAGVSLPNILNAKHVDDNGEASEVEHVFVTTGYVFEPEDYLKIKPSFLSKIAPGAPVSFDVSLNFLLQEVFEIGVSHRLDDSWAGMANYRVSRHLRIGYAYDYTVSPLNNFNNGSHEIMVLYQVDLSKRELKSPRFF